MINEVTQVYKAKIWYQECHKNIGTNGDIFTWPKYPIDDTAKNTGVKAILKKTKWKKRKKNESILWWECSFNGSESKLFLSLCHQTFIKVADHFLSSVDDTVNTNLWEKTVKHAENGQTLAWNGPPHIYI